MGEEKRTKKVRPGIIEIDSADQAIVVHYEVEQPIYDADGTLVDIEKKESTKRIKVKSLNESTNISALAQEIVEKCKLIHHSKLPLVEELLHELQSQKLGLGYGRAGHEDHSEARERPAPMMEYYGGVEAHLVDLDDYMEQLYEDENEKKVQATYMIAQLTRRTENLEVFISHETLLGALARVLREDGRKSIDLCVNIMSVFFSLSNFSQFHQAILDNQMGAMAMNLIDLELKRWEMRNNEDPNFGKATQKAAAGEPLSDKYRKYLHIIRKQDRLLYVCTYMLLNLSEDISVERKMKKRSVVVYLVKMLDRYNVELLILVVTFLKKLSIYKENKEKMVECRLVEKLMKFVPVKNDVLLISVLRLLHNLSFDVDNRDEMVRNGMIPKGVELMRSPAYRQVIMALLYHVSIDDKYKSMFTYTDAILMILDLLLKVEDLRTAPELIALAVNLTQNSRNAEVMCEGDGLHLLMQRSMSMHDELCFKVVRNLSQGELDIKLKFRPYIEPLVQLLKAQETNSDLMVEVLGTLANLNIPEFNFLALVRKYDLLHYLSMHLEPGVVEDDIILEVVMFVGVLCVEETAPLIVNAGLVTKLYHLMSEKKEDDEFVLQITFTFHRMLLFAPTRTALLNNTQQVVFYLVDLLQDKNKQVRKTADAALDLIIDCDEEWAVKIRRMKFESYNQEWLEVADADDAEGHEHAGMYMGRQGTDADSMGSDEEVDHGQLHARRQVYGGYEEEGFGYDDEQDGQGEHFWNEDSYSHDMTAGDPYGRPSDAEFDNDQYL